jgi:SAM-dependent methyltransferase
MKIIGKWDPLKIVRESIANRGLKRTILIMFGLAEDLVFDLKYGTDTFRWSALNETDLYKKSNDGHSTDYVPTKAIALKKVLKGLDIEDNDNFVDLGSGKGRTLLIASEFGFRKVIGVEFSKTLCDISTKNALKFREKAPWAAEIEVRFISAEEYRFSAFDNFIYLFNPFDNVLMNRVLCNLQDSLQENPRKLTIIYNNPECHDLILQKPFIEFVQRHSIRGNFFNIYQSKSDESIQPAKCPG